MWPTKICVFSSVAFSQNTLSREVRNPTAFSQIKYYNQSSENSIFESRNVMCIKYDPDNGQWPILVQSQNSQKRQILDDPFF